MDGKTIAYLSMEYAIEENLPIYAGGLGVLAADLVLEAGSQNLNFVGLGIFYNHGFHAHFHDGVETLDPTSANFHLLTDAFGKPISYFVPMENRFVHFQVWEKSYGSARLLLLDTNVAENTPEDKAITFDLYGDHDAMFAQQVLLGLGSLYILSSQNVTPDVFHLNEGHTAITALALAAQHKRTHPDCSLEDCLKAVSPQIVATKHTILAGGGLYLPQDQLQKFLGSFLDQEKFSVEELFKLGTHETHPETFSTTNFLLRFAVRASAVSVAHAEAEKQVHPHSHLIPITNGINQKRWQQKPLGSGDLKDFNDHDLWQLHQQNKAQLLDHLQELSGQRLDQNVLLVTWARRFTSYKRPELLFNNMDELAKMVKLFGSVQFVVAGQTNPNDSEAMELAARIKRNLEDQQLHRRIILLTKYDIMLAKFLVAGSDVWLNTPTPGLEASGTSGMKAGINGVLQFSTNDGWLEEINWKDIGWILFEQDIGRQLYKILEEQIIPEYYRIDKSGLPENWLSRMSRTIDIVEQFYTTRRVLAGYYEQLYFPKNP